MFLYILLYVSKVLTLCICLGPFASLFFCICYMVICTLFYLVRILYELVYYIMYNIFLPFGNLLLPVLHAFSHISYVIRIVQ